VRLAPVRSAAPAGAAAAGARGVFRIRERLVAVSSPLRRRAVPHVWASLTLRRTLTASAQRLRRNSRAFDADGRVLRLKRFISADAGSALLDAVLDALAVNTRVEVLYIQNFERGFKDAQLSKLVDVLRLRRIWAVNVVRSSAPLAARPFVCHLC